MNSSSDREQLLAFQGYFINKMSRSAKQHFAATKSGRDKTFKRTHTLCFITPCCAEGVYDLKRLPRNSNKSFRFSIAHKPSHAIANDIGELNNETRCQQNKVTFSKATRHRDTQTS